MQVQVIPNSDITIYNKYIDPTTRKEKYQRTVVKNVVWQAAKAVYATGAGMVRSDTATVFIPFARDAAYLKPHAWQAAKTGKWTLQENDVIVRGSITTEITDSFTMTQLRAANDDVVTINSVARMDEGSPNMRHWQVGAK